MINKEQNQSKYRLSKTVIQKSPISLSCDILNTQTNEVWRAKVFDLEKVNSNGMLNALQYNEEVFYFLRNNYQNSLYLQKCFTKNDKEYLVFQPWQVRLSDYISCNANGLKDKQEVKNILQQVLLSLCDIYAQDFMVLNLKPQNIVRVSSPNQDQLGWRIQSLVFQYQTHNLPSKCYYQFDYDWGSNEEKTLKQNLEDNLKDEQIVWYMGILALRLIYGTKFKLNSKFKDSDLNLNEIRQKCLPQVFQLIQKSVKANIKDRIPLKSFLQLNIFNRLQISSDLKQKFQSGNQMRIKKSMSIKNSVLKKSSIRQNQLKISLSRKLQLSKTSKLLIPQTKMSTYYGSLSETKAKRMFHQFRWILEKCFYFTQIKNYTQSAASIDETNVQDKTVVRYIYFKLAEINLNKFLNILHKSTELLSFRQSQFSKGYYLQLLASIKQNENLQGKKPLLQQTIEYEKKMRILDPKKLKLLSNLQSLVSKLKKNIQNSNISLQNLSQLFSMVNGMIFSSLKKFLEKNDRSKVQNRGIKIRALCFFTFSSYLIIVNPIKENTENSIKQLLECDFQLYQIEYLSEKKLQGSIHVKFADDVEFIRLSQYTSQAKEQTLVTNAQILLNKYFKTINIQQKDSNTRTLNTMPGKRSSLLTVPDKNLY